MKRWAIQVARASLALALLLVTQPGKLPRSQAGAPVITAQNAAALQQVGQDQYTPWDLVHAVAWAPDGQQLAVTAGENLLLYQPPEVDPHFEQALGVWSPGLAYHPTQPWLALGGRDGSLAVFDLQRNAFRWRVTAHPKGITHLAASPDGTWLASGGYEAYARLWDFRSGDNLAQMIGGTYAIPDLAVTVDGSRVAIANGDVIRLREAGSGRISLSIYARESIASLAISANGSLLATGSANGKLDLWSLPAPGSGSTILDESIQLPNPAAQAPRSLDRLVWEVAFNPDGMLLAVAQGSGEIQIWDLTNRNIAATLDGHPGGATCVAFSPDGRTLASGGLDAVVRLWQVSP